MVQSTSPNIFISIFEYSGELDITSLLDNFEVKNRLLGNSVIGFNKSITTLQSINSELLSVLKAESKKLN